ncbi:glyoxylate/hydroxypyruvate reductase A [Rhizobium sp. CSW-27]|uniref:2-hydroxyacid dehydrogenase n=1 Tax=Rhizobium sp. CSW-27 TaxID=2839985 RepID=UPI001C02FAE3|nr:glyoxylate/hydroxypyruvate reductase A [Rhizobium sp. CSW-27]MBT9372229.1 glyoxylate/hydroxypyruvate reductase A [Rhizobium sp. CSW-27]
MLPPIAFVTRLSTEEEQNWLEVLRRAMPEERILPFRELMPEERRLAEIAIVANPDPADVAALPGLSFIHSLWAGVERLVMELGVTAPPIVRLVDPELSRVMAEAVLAWTFYLQRDMPAYRAAQGDRRWAPRDYRHPAEVSVGLLGLGALGSRSAARLTEAGFRVEGWSRTPKDMPEIATHHGEAGLDTLLSASDIVVCLLPLTAETRGLLNAERLARMPQGAALINFARGAVVVAHDLIAALDRGHLDHAVLDVFEVEPLPEASPFWSHPKVTVLPHISAPTTPATAARIVAGNIATWRRNGALPATVDRSRGY